MRKWLLPFCVIAFFVFLTALFLTPDFTQSCTEDLLMCVENAGHMNFFQKLWATLICVCKNVVCVLKGLFV